MSSEKFELAQDEVDSLLERVGTELKQLLAAEGEAKKRLQQVCLRNLEDGGRLVEEMEAEARRAPLQYRAQMLATVRSYRSRLSVLQSGYHKSSRLPANGSNTGTAGSGDRTVTDSYRDKVVAGTRIMERTGESLHRAQQVAVETETVGTGIIEDLGTQREALERTRGRLIETDLELGRSRKILRKMYLNVISNKIILICIILIEAAILAGLVYWKFFSK